MCIFLFCFACLSSSLKYICFQTNLANIHTCLHISVYVFHFFECMFCLYLIAPACNFRCSKEKISTLMTLYSDNSNIKKLNEKSNNIFTNEYCAWEWNLVCKCDVGCGNGLAHHQRPNRMTISRQSAGNWCNNSANMIFITGMPVGCVCISLDMCLLLGKNSSFCTRLYKYLLLS